MTSDTDILRAANQLIDQYGDDALDHAREWVEECHESDDREGEDMWRRIVRAIADLSSDRAPAGTRLH